MMFGNKYSWTIAFTMFVMSSAVCWSQNSTDGYVHPPKQFIQFIDGDFAASFGGTSGGGCGCDLLELDRGATGKWKLYTIKDKTPLFEEADNYSKSSYIDFRTALSVVEVGKSMLKVQFVG